MANNPTPKSKTKPLTVVGIGASAGGLSALKTIFDHVPEDTGLAFVIIMHLSPEHESHLADLLQRHIKIPVLQVMETLPLEANHVYVIAPGCNLSAIDTHLRLSDMEAQRKDRAPIDHFFRTLAATYDGSSIGIILTGTGSDGTLGIKEIKQKGGLIMVQDPNEAEFDGMPQSAIATGMVDLVLPLEEMPAHILGYTRTKPQMVVTKVGEEVEDDEGQLLQKVFAQLRVQTSRDFSHYKYSTIMRRLQRRMQLFRIEKLEDYLQMLRDQPEEVHTLSDDFLINVTSFFRDTEVFIKLEQQVIPELFKRKQPEDSLRVWSVGCATGEEAYSLAILLKEAADRHEEPPKIQVFASDLHEHSLQKAREGIYPGDIETDVSPERIKRFFTKEDSTYRIRKEVREMVVFTPHNLLSDPPFSKIDLIVCRNLLIYLQRKVQRDIIALFHYALKAEGFLLLGTSETVEKSELFGTEDKQHCLYRKRNVQSPEPRLPVFPLIRHRLPGEPREAKYDERPASYGALHQQMVEQYAPPSLLVSPDEQVVHLSEHVGHYLVHPSGELTANVYKLVREELRIELRVALHAAKEKKMALHSKPIPLQVEGAQKRIILSVYPGQLPQQEYMLVTFEEWQGPEPAIKAGSTSNKATIQDARVRELEAESSLAKQRLQTIIKEHDTSQEEMKAANEEMQSTNEELRSIMEELETSKEELQSMNEELTTLNQENRQKVAELAQLSADLQNLFKATDIATLFLDRQLRILRFTPRLGELFNVRTVDRGRPLSDITHRLGYHHLTSDARQVLDKLEPVEREAQDEEGCWYLMRVLPYRSGEDKIEGVVITFVDITERKRAEEELHEAKVYAEKIVETLHEPILVLSPDLRVQSVNQAFYEHFKVQKEETVGRLIYELGNGQWDIEELHTLLEDVLPDSKVFKDYEVTHTFEDIGERVMLLNARRLDHIQFILLGIRDITEKKKAEEVLRKSQERLQRMVNIESVGVQIFDVSGILIGANDAFLHMTGYSRQEIESRKLTWRYMTPPEHIASSEQQMQQLEETGRIGPYEKEYFHKDDSRLWLLFVGASLGDGSIIEYCIDVSDRKQAEEALRKSEERFRLMADAIPQIIWIADEEGHMEFFNSSFFTYTGSSLMPATAQQATEKFIHPEDVEMTITNWEKALQQSSTFTVEHRMKSASGEYRWFLVRAEPQLDRDTGAVLRWFGTSTDIHDNKLYEEALREAKEAAEKAAKAKEEFLAHMSHEIRTPLSAVVGLANLLLKQHPQREQLENLQTLKFSAENLKLLINDILDFSKIQAGKVNIEEKQVRLKDLLHSLQKVHEPRAAEQGNELVFHIDKEIPEVICTDQLKLSQVLHNLIGNAVKFTHQGLVTVEVSLSRKEADQLLLDFSISDTGIGIPEDKHTSIFEAFTQADVSTGRQYEGTGLGLSITKMLLELLGSQIAIESQKGKGSRFFFNLPAKENKSQASAADEPTQAQQADLSHIQLLLVEDTAINRMVLKQFLQDWWQLTPDEASDGVQAVAMVKQKKYDLILMDIRMPGMDGYQAAKAIRAIGENYASMPIIALTADTVEEVEKHPEAALFTDVLTKPFDPADLQQKLILHAPGKKRKASSSKVVPDLEGKQGKADTAISTHEVDITKVRKLFKQDSKQIQVFLDKAISELAILQEKFKAASDARNTSEIGNLIHKASLLMDMLSLHELKELLEQGRSLLAEDATQAQIEEMQQKVKITVEQVIAALKKHLEQVK